MFNKLATTAALAALLVISVGGAAFAADAVPAAPKAAAVKVSGMTHEQKKEIYKSCKQEHKGDRAAIKTCVKEKKAAAGK